MAPGLDYLNEPFDPREDNYFKSGLSQLIIDTAAPWAIAQGAKKYRQIVRPSKSMYDEYRNIRKDLKSSLVASDRISRGGEISELYKKARSSRAVAGEIATTASRYGKIFGIAGAVITGYEIGKSLLGLSNTFQTTPEDIAQSRRALYNGGEEYFDSRAAFTQRQRAIQVIHNSQMSTRAALGSEASFMHY